MLMLESCLITDVILALVFIFGRVVKSWKKKKKNVVFPKAEGI